MSDNGSIWIPVVTADTVAMMAARAFYEKHGRPPIQEEWERYWYNGCTFEGLDVH